MMVKASSSGNILDPSSNSNKNNNEMHLIFFVKGIFPKIVLHMVEKIDIEGGG